MRATGTSWIALPRSNWLPGERQRDRALNDKEIENYLAACPQPWKDCATIILDEGLRPGEVFPLRWSAVVLNNDGTGLVTVVDGKSLAARRTLPMTHRVHALLQARYEALGRPADGWVFPSSRTRCGHFTEGTAKDHHKKAREDSGTERFVPYTLRHTALTVLATAALVSRDIPRSQSHSGTSIRRPRRFSSASSPLPKHRSLQDRKKGVGTRVGTKLGTNRKMLGGVPKAKTA